MESLKLDKDKLKDFIAALDSKKVYAPQKVGETIKFAPVNGDLEVSLDFANTTVPPKEIVFPQTETMFLFEQGGTDINLTKGGAEKVLLGVRPCDARAMSVVDNLFSWDIDDPYYLDKRKKITLVGLACLEPPLNCFCPSVGGGPASTEGLDILMTDLGDAYLFQPLTPKGEQLCQLSSELLQPAGAEDNARAEELHREAEKKITREVDIKGLAEGLPSLWKSEIWKEAAEPCLGCGICTYLCPTCHCFDIQDEMEGLDGRRCRMWDSCLFKEYTLHASGHNPRPSRRERQRNRINHKFSYFVDKFGVTACVGCGRCINLCPVNIDIVDILSKVKEAL